MDVFANDRAIAAWGYSSVLEKAYTKDNKLVGSKTLQTGSKGAGFASLRASIKALILGYRKGGGVNFQFTTGKARL